jgi:hypothetical protein
MLPTDTATLKFVTATTRTYTAIRSRFFLTFWDSVRYRASTRSTGNYSLTRRVASQEDGWKTCKAPDRTPGGGHRRNRNRGLSFARCPRLAARAVASVEEKRSCQPAKLSARPSEGLLLVIYAPRTVRNRFRFGEYRGQVAKNGIAHRVLQTGTSVR